MPELHSEAQLLRERLDGETATDDELRAVRARVLDGLERRRPRRLMQLSLAGAATMAVAVAAVVFWPRAESWFEPLAGDACLSSQSETALSTGSCTATIAIDNDRIALSPGTVLERQPRALRLKRGRASFQVAKRTAEPFRVRVSAATIVVIGTQFTVEEHDGRGSVAVTEGVVEVQWHDGAREEVAAGGEAVWPRPPALENPEPEPEPEPAVGVPPDGIDRPDVRTIMERLFQLRSQRRYDDAVRMLRKASRRRDLSRAQRERLSYEAGTVLRQAGRTGAACAHLGAHVKRFPESAKRDEVRTLLGTCAPTPSRGN